MRPSRSKRLIAKEVRRSRRNGNNSVASRNDSEIQPLGPRTCLDLLPLEVGALLAEFFRREPGHFCASVANSAEVSIVHRNAMLASQNYTLDARNSVAMPLTLGYVKMFIGVIRKVKVRDLYLNNEDVRRCIARLLGEPTLVSASIEADFLSLRSIAMASSLRELYLKLNTWNSMKLVNQALRMLNLKVLRIVCNGEHMCMYGRSRSKSLWKEIGENCQNVSILEVGCVCKFPRQNTFLSALVAHLPNLKSLILGLPDEESLLEECNLESLTLRMQFNRGYGCNFEKMVAIATRWPGIVKGIEMDPEQGIQGINPALLTTAEFMKVARSEGIMGLEHCTCLEVLHLGLLRGAEESLPAFDSLQSLHLRWFEEFDHGHRQEIGNRFEFYMLDSRFYERIVATGTNLQSLALYDVRISMADLEMLLKGIGDRLREFGTSVCRQDEGIMERMVAVLDTLRRYNPGLKQILDLTTTYQYWDIVPGMSDEMKKTVVIAVRMLKRTAIEWDMTSFVEKQRCEAIMAGV